MRPLWPPLWATIWTPRLTPRAAAYWGGADAPAPSWPTGVTPLSAHVQAPDQLTARLALCGVAAKAEAAKLAETLPPGARLVTTDGDLYRWDGFVSRAEAPRPAAVRLAQRTRLAELEAEIDKGKPALEQAQGQQKSATDAFRAAEEEVKAARLKPFAADKAVTSARDRVETLARDQARREARAQALDDTVTRLAAEVAEAQTALDAAQTADAPSETLADLRNELAAARSAADTARTAAQTARLRPRRRGPRPSGPRTEAGRADPRPRRLGQPVKGQRRPRLRPDEGRRQDRRPC